MSEKTELCEAVEHYDVNFKEIVEGMLKTSGLATTDEDLKLCHHKLTKAIGLTGAKPIEFSICRCLGCGTPTIMMWLEGYPNTRFKIHRHNGEGDLSFKIEE